MTKYVKHEAARIGVFAEALGVATLYMLTIGLMMQQVARAAGYL